MSFFVWMVAGAQVASAATRSWNAPAFGGDRRWSIAANWSGGVPVNGDSLIFNEKSDTTFQDECTNNISNLQLGSLLFNGTEGAVPDLFGNGVTVSGGISEAVSFWGVGCFVPVTLSASQTFESLLDGHLDLTNVNLSTHTLTLDTRLSTSRIAIGGRISGSGGIIVTGPGRVTFASPLTNTYTGLTRVNSGRLSLVSRNGTDGVPSVPGDLIVGDGITSAEVTISADNQVEGDVTLKSGAQLLMSGSVDSFPSLTMIDAKALIISGGVLGLAGPLTVGGTSNSTIDGSVSLGSASRTFSVSNNVTFRMDGIVSGANLGTSRPGITKSGPGTLLLLSNNTFGGSMTINTGRVIATMPRALGSESGEILGLQVGRTFVNEGGELMLAAVRITNEVLLLSTTQRGLSSTGACAWVGGDIFLNTNVPVNVSNSTLTLECDVAGTGGFVKTGAGTLTLTGTNANNFTGLTRVQSGLMILNKIDNVLALAGSLTIGDGAGGANADIARVSNSEQIADTAEVTILSSGQLDLNASETIGSLDGSGMVRLDGGDLTVGANGMAADYTGTVVGTFGLTKIGAGTQRLGGNNTYTGLTRVLAGMLQVDGQQPQSAVNVIGAALAGDGTVGHLTSSGRVVPGGSGFGILSTSNLTFQAGGSLEIQLGGNTAGTQHDQLSVRGSVALANAALNLSLAPGFLPASGDTFLVLSNDGADAIGGTFAGLANNSLITTSPGRRFRIRYNAGDGNDVMLTFTNETVSLRPLQLSVGNANGRFDPDECNLLGGAVTNHTSQAVPNVTVEFFPRSAGVTISHPLVSLGNLAPNAITAIPSQVVVSLVTNVTCGSIVQLDAELRSSGVFMSSARVSFTVGSGGVSGCVDGGGICAYCPDVVIHGTLMSGDLLQSARLRNTTPASCSTGSACPGVTGTGTRLVDAMVFQNGPRTACITVTLSNRCTAGLELLAAAYVGKFNPGNLCENYLADLGENLGGGKTSQFSFRLGANEVFVLTVNEADAGSTCGDYTVTVSGGDCRPRLTISDIPGPNVRLSWPNTAAGWIPQFSGGLSNWSDLSGTQTNADSRYHLDTSGAQPARFFRLQEP